MNEAHDLELMVKAQVPILVVETQEENRLLDLVRRVANRLGVPAYKWTVTEGVTCANQHASPLSRSNEKPIDVLGHVKTHGSKSIYVLNDFHHYLGEATPVRLLKDIAIQYDRLQCTMILVSHQLTLPEELQRFSRSFNLALPGYDQLKEIVYEVAGEWGARHGNRSVEASNKTLEELVQNLKGLTVSDAKRLARNVIYDDGAITASDMPEVMKAKYELLGQDGVLSFEYETAHFSDIGGLSRLKSWLDKRRAVFKRMEKEALKLDPPKGVLLLGVQGCGKSVAAKAAAGIFGVPLLKLDFGTLYNKYYGETERNLRQALETAEVMSPCVLWMDEIEKGVSGDDDQGTSKRVLGTFLTWMAEKSSPVFLVATANDIQSLPPELIRKGRFDETFFVDLPSADVRREILQIHLEKRGLHWVQFDRERLVAASEGFSGAEIEQAIVSALYGTYADGKKLSTDDLVSELETTRPLSVVMAEQIEALRSWAADRTVPSD